MVLPLVERKTKATKSIDALTVLLQLGSVHKDGLDGASIRSQIACIVMILQSLETKNDVWENDIVKKSFTLLLRYSINESGKVRHQAQNELEKLFKQHSEDKFILSSQMLMTYLTNLNDMFDGKDAKDITYFLALVARLSPYLDSSVYESFLSILMKVCFLCLNISCYFTI